MKTNTPINFTTFRFDLNKISTRAIGMPSTAAVIVESKTDLIRSSYEVNSPLIAIKIFSRMK